ncbi:MAG: ABC transporter substrate-binding protein [Promethearchaeota archaeon]
MAEIKREIAIVAIVAALGIGILGGWFIPAPTPTPTRTSLLDHIKATNTLNIGTSADYPPFEFWNITVIPNEIQGFDVDLCDWIADELGVNIQWTDMPFGSLITACANGKIDMIAAAMTYNTNRSTYLAATVPYITVGQAVIVRNDSSLTISSLDDLVGHTVGCQLGTTLWDDLVLAGVTPTGFVTVDALIQDLILGGVEAAYVDEPVFTSWSRTYDLKIILRTGTEPFSLWTRYGQPELLFELNNVILASYLDGRMFDNMEKWLNITS